MSVLGTVSMYNMANTLAVINTMIFLVYDKLLSVRYKQIFLAKWIVHE